MKKKLLTLGNLQRFVSWIDLALIKLQNSYRAEIEWRWYPNAMQDYDGNWYDAVQIGDQVWLAQNLRCTHTPSGVAVAAGGSSQSTIDPYYYQINNISATPDYGLLYNYPAAKLLPPTGWKVPTKAEFEELEEYMAEIENYHAIDGDDTSLAKALAARAGWGSSNVNGAIGNDLDENNNTRFGILPAGYWFGDYSNFGTGAMIWSTTGQTKQDKYALSLDKDYATVMYPSWYLDCALSVRLLSEMNATEFEKWYIEQYGSLNHVVMDAAIEIEYVQTASLGAQGYTLTKSPAEIKALLANGKYVILTNGSVQWTLVQGSATAQGLMFGAVYMSSRKPFISTIWYVADNGLETVWKIADFQLQQELTSGTTLKTVDGNTLLGSGDVVTEDWQLDVINNGTNTYNITINRIITTTNIVIDNSLNGTDVAMDFEMSGLDKLYVEGDKTVGSGEIKIFRIKCYEYNREIIGVVTEKVIKSI